MSEFNRYARMIDSLAKRAFREYGETERAFERAQELRDAYPLRYGTGVSAEYLVKSSRAQADFLTAEENLRTAKRALENHVGEIASLRRELETEVSEYYSADPAALDGNTIELLRSGILDSGEYQRLLENAQADQNFTMARMIGRYAADAAEARAKELGENDPEATAMRAVSYSASENDASDIMYSFDTLAEAFRRSVDNPSMMSAWSELTGSIVENL